MVDEGMLDFDAHQKPSESLRKAYKTYQKCNVDDEAVINDPHVVDFARGLLEKQQSLFTKFPWRRSSDLKSAFHEYLHPNVQGAFPSTEATCNEEYVDAFRCNASEGLIIMPGLIPIEVQRTMLSRLLHRDLSASQHKTNIHFHHDIKYAQPPQSFFSYRPEQEGVLESKDPHVHKEMTVESFLNRKLRWVTLGGQYDWTAKVYPNDKPPAFPSDHRKLLHSLFPETEPEAAIVNLYAPRDILSLHRDVSEYCGNGLISLSIGCDALFMITTTDMDDYLILRLHSGDVVYMSGKSRFAYHGVPQVVPETCPEELRAWPLGSAGDADPTSFSDWRGWMAAKRINLNVRQMFQ